MHKKFKDSDRLGFIIVFIITLAVLLWLMDMYYNLALEHYESKEVYNFTVEKLQKRIEDYDSKIDNLEKQIIELREENSLLKKEQREQQEIKQPSRGATSRTFNVTAYTDTPSCQERWVGITASGVKPKAGRTVAAGKNIPFGTILYIPYFKDKPNNGIFIVEDRGGAIKDNNLDIFMDTKQEALEFGRRNLEVYILHWGDNNSN